MSLDRDRVKQSLSESIVLKQTVLDDPGRIDQMLRMAERVVATIRSGHRVYLCGNGGSAADAQHLAAELLGRFQMERDAWPATALTTDTSILTAVANDLGFERVFARQVQALARAGDMLIVLSTSGNSANILEAARAARALGVTVLGFSGRDGGKLRPLCDECFLVPSDVTCRIQEVHITVGHVICDFVERSLTRPR